MYVVSPSFKRPPFADKMGLWFSMDGIRVANGTAPSRLDCRAGSGVVLNPGVQTFNENRVRSRPAITAGGLPDITDIQPSPQSGEIFMVVRHNISSTTQTLPTNFFMIGGRFTAPTNGIYLGCIFGATKSIYFHIANAGTVLQIPTVATTFSQGVWYLLHASFTPFGVLPGLSAYVNGALSGTTPRATVPTIAFTNTYAQVGIGIAGGSSATGLNADIAEIIVLSDFNVDAAGKKMVEDYFNSKYAIF